MSEEDEEWKKEAKKYEDACIDLSDKLHIPVEKKEQFVKLCEIHAVKTGQLPSLENYPEWESEFKEQLASFEEQSRHPTKTEKEVLLEACLISPESVPDPKLRKQVQEACNTLITKSWKLFEDPDLDALTCAFQTAGIQDGAERKELELLCVTKMGESGADLDKKVVAARKLEAFSRSEILPEVMRIYITNKDPVKIRRMLDALWEEKNLPFVIKLVQLKYKKINPVAKKIKRARRARKWEGLTLESAIELYNTEILPQVRQRLEEKGRVLPADYVPTRIEVAESGFGGFIGALATKKIGYTDLISEAGYVPREMLDVFDIGTKAHFIQEQITMESTRRNNLDSYYEVFPSKFVNRKRPDLTIIVNEFFREKHNIPKEIALINVDFSTSSDKTIILEKGNRGYQGKHKLFIIVPGTTKANIPTPEGIPYRKNVKILNPWKFASFIGLNEKETEHFIYAYKLAQRANYDPSVRKELDLLAEKSQEYLKNLHPSMQKEFEDKLKQFGLLNLLRSTSIPKKLDDFLL